MEKPRILIIGSRGFLGSHVALAAAGKFVVIEGNRTTLGRPDDISIDVRDEGSVETAFEAARPEVALLFAAVSDIDRCEQFPEEARAINIRGTQHVVKACARRNTRLLFISTAAVFDGRQHGYAEQSPVSPVNVYGETKAEAEKLVLTLGPLAIVVRIALALGFTGRSDTNSFMDGLKRQWVSGQSVALPVFEQRNPIDAVTFSRFVLELLKKQETQGIFHIGCLDPISRYELGRKLAARMGYSGQLRPQLDPTPGRAPRGPDHYLLTDKLRTICTIPIPTCDQVIERCFDGLA